MAPSHVEGIHTQSTRKNSSASFQCSPFDVPTASLASPLVHSTCNFVCDSTYQKACMCEKGIRYAGDLKINVGCHVHLELSTAPRAAWPRLVSPRPTAASTTTSFLDLDRVAPDQVTNAAALILLPSSPVAKYSREQR